MTTADQALREAAQKADEGEKWEYDGMMFVMAGGRGMVCEPHGEGRGKMDVFGTYIALANPQAVLSLLERLERAEKDRTEAVELLKYLRGYLCTHSEYQKGYMSAEQLMDEADAFLNRNQKEFLLVNVPDSTPEAKK